MTLIFFWGGGGGEEVRWKTVRTYGKILATPLLTSVRKHGFRSANVFGCRSISGAAKTGNSVPCRSSETTRKRLLRRVERKPVIALVSVNKTRFVREAMSSEDRKKLEKS